MTISERPLGFLNLALVTLAFVGLLLVGLSRLLHADDIDDTGVMLGGEICCDCDVGMDPETRQWAIREGILPAPPPTCFERSDREACLRDELADQVDAYLTGVDGHRPIPHRH